jgi:hypothetical protein
MEQMTECTIVCPYCWQPLQILVARPDLPAELVEDCQVCCQPIALNISVEPDGDLTVDAEAESR